MILYYRNKAACDFAISGSPYYISEPRLDRQQHLDRENTGQKIYRLIVNPPKQTLIHTVCEQKKRHI